MNSKYNLELTAQNKPLKFVFYGPEGIGKSTLASKLPSPIFIDTEGSTTFMDVLRYPKPQSWETLLDMVDDAGRLSPRPKTLVIDTADWAERLCITDLLQANGWEGIEDLGYGKGYTYLKEHFGVLLDRMTALIDKGINVGFNAHAQLRKIENPEDSGAYDHWELKCSKQVAPMIKEWSDIVLFINYKTMVIHGANKMEKNKITGGKRVIYTTHNPAWDAKNRFGLQDELPLEYASIKSVFERNSVPDPKAVQTPVVDPVPLDDLNLLEDPFEPEMPTAKPESEWTEEEKASVASKNDLSSVYPELHQLMEANGFTYEEIQKAVSARGYYPGDMPIELYPTDFVKGCLVAAWSSVKDLIIKNRG